MKHLNAEVENRRLKQSFIAMLDIQNITFKVVCNCTSDAIYNVCNVFSRTFCRIAIYKYTSNTNVYKNPISHEHISIRTSDSE